jgi:hypothetical protein
VTDVRLLAWLGLVLSPILHSQQFGSEFLSAVVASVVVFLAASLLSLVVTRTVKGRRLLWPVGSILVTQWLLALGALLVALLAPR